MFNSLMNILLLITVFTAVTFLPIWLLGKVAKAKRSTWFFALLAALQMGVIFAISQSTYLNIYATTAFQLIGGAAVFRYTLDTSFFRASTITILVFAIFVLCLYFLLGDKVSLRAS